MGIVTSRRGAVVVAGLVIAFAVLVMGTGAASAAKHPALIPSRPGHMRAPFYKTARSHATHIAIDGRKKARAIARLLNRSPIVTGSREECMIPAAGYRLTFFYKVGRAQKVWIDASDCRFASNLTTSKRLRRVTGGTWRRIQEVDVSPLIAGGVGAQ